MIIKNIDPITDKVKELEKLMKINLPEGKKNKIARELQNIKKGHAGEKQAAFYINEVLGVSDNWIVIHDLRLEHSGQFTQFDHIAINKLGIIFVFETKNWGGKIVINESGEFIQKINGKQCGAESPIEQNKRHIRFLKRYIEDNGIYPKRLGIRIKPNFKNMILLTKEAIIERPNHKVFDSRSVIKMEQFSTKFNEYIDSLSVFIVAKIVKYLSLEQLENIWKEIVSCHKPLSVDYDKKYRVKYKSAPVHKKKKYYCASCKKDISEKEATFCWSEKFKKRFGGKAYCITCQKNVK